jgi:hypothetical protein
VRTVLRTALQAIAPLAFGFVSSAFGGQGAGFTEAGRPHSTTALDRTFLIMLVPLLATAAASERATGRPPGEPE